MIGTGHTAGFAQTRAQQLALEAPDGARITGFLLQDAKADKDAPLAILMHAMAGSSLHWLAKDNVSGGDDISADLVKRGYRVVGLDARSHGVRRDAMAPVKRLEELRSNRPDPYLAMINGTMSDYDVLLEDVKGRFGKPGHVLVIGYSMGAQMAVLFAAKHAEVTHVVTMVPPAAASAPSVAPVHHARKVKANWLLLTASRDEFATKADNEALASAAAGTLTHVVFDSPHMLPNSYVDTVIDWIGKIAVDSAAK
jgi:dienelactone hydrolase